MSRRLARVVIPQFGIAKRELISAIQALPDDATLIRACEVLSRAETVLIFESSSVAEVKEGAEIPVFRQMPVAKKAAFSSWNSLDTPKECDCDFEYQGFSQHLRTCSSLKG